MTERKRRPHYQERRAHADGWEIEHRMITMQDGWRPVFNHPDFDNPNLEFHIVPDADGWLPWYGSEDGKGPLEGNPMVEAEFAKANPGLVSDLIRQDTAFVLLPDMKATQEKV